MGGLWADCGSWALWASGTRRFVLLFEDGVGDVANSLDEVVGDFRKKRRLHGPILVNSEHGAELIALAAQRFKVSKDAARVRLSKLQIIGESAVALATE